VDEAALCPRIIVGRQVGAVYNHTPPMIYNIIILCTTVYATGLIKRKFSINLLPHPRVCTLTHADQTSLRDGIIRIIIELSEPPPLRIGHRYPMRFCLFFNNHASVAAGYTYPNTHTQCTLTIYSPRKLYCIIFAADYLLSHQWYKLLPEIG